MNTFLILLLSLVALHVIIDFYLQPDAWVKDKLERHERSSKLLYHAIIQGAVSCIPILLISMDWKSIICMFIVIGASHWAIDLVKTYLETNSRYLLIDQALHILILTGVSLHASQLEWTYDEIIKSVITEKNIVIALGYIIILRPASVLIGSILKKYTPMENEENKGLISGGAVIGYLERVLMLSFTIAGEFSAIGFILAAKSIFRFGELNNANKHQLTEYVLLGSLLSITITAVVGLVINRWLQ